MLNVIRGAVALLFVSTAFSIMAANVLADAPLEIALPRAVTIESTYLGLSQGPLRATTLVALPKGILLRAGKVTITDKQLAAEIAKASPDMQPVLKKNSFLILEQMATRQMLTQEARVWATETKRDTRKDTDATLIQAFLTSIADDVTVSDAETQTFYDANKELVGGASYEAVVKELKAYLLEQKQQETVGGYVNSLSDRIPVEVSQEWLKGQAATMLDNPVDKARRSGKPSMVDFGREGCGPCDMMTPILAELSKTYAAQCNVLFSHVGNEPILASRYGVQSIPTQVFFDKNGSEVFRHVGFFATEQILAKLSELGVE